MSKLYEVRATFTMVEMQHVWADSEEAAREIAANDIDWGVAGWDYEDEDYEVTLVDED